MWRRHPSPQHRNPHPDIPRDAFPRVIGGQGLRLAQRRQREAGAVAVDVAALAFHVPYVNLLNFLFVWLAVHQLGYAWNAGHFARPIKALVGGWAVSPRWSCWSASGPIRSR